MPRRYRTFWKLDTGYGKKKRSPQGLRLPMPRFADDFRKPRETVIYFEEAAGQDSETVSIFVTWNSFALLLADEAEAPVPVAFELPALPAMLPAALFWVSALPVPALLFALVLVLAEPLGELLAEFEAIEGCSMPSTRTCLFTFEDRSSVEFSFSRSPLIGWIK